MEQKTDKETTTIQNISVVEHKTSKQFQICLTTRKNVESLWLSEEEFGHLMDCINTITTEKLLYDKEHNLETEEISGNSGKEEKVSI